MSSVVITVLSFAHTAYRDWKETSKRQADIIFETTDRIDFFSVAVAGAKTGSEYFDAVEYLGKPSDIKGIPSLYPHFERRDTLSLLREYWWTKHQTGIGNYSTDYIGALIEDVTPFNDSLWLFTKHPERIEAPSEYYSKKAKKFREAYELFGMRRAYGRGVTSGRR